MQGRFADYLAIGFDLRARRRSLNQDIVGDSAVRAALRTRRHRLATCNAQESGQPEANCPLPSHNINCPKNARRATDATPENAAHHLNFSETSNFVLIREIFK